MLRAVTRGLNQEAWGNWLPPTVFSLNITVSRTTGISPYQLVHGRDPPIPLTTMVGLPDREPLDPAEYMLTLSATMGRLLTMAQGKYQVYLRRIANTYTARSPLGSGQPLGMRVWCWSPYQKKGKSGALSAKWSGPWRIIEFKPPALSLLQSEWLHLKGKPEIQREAVIDKLQPYIGNDSVQEDLEDDKLALIDRDDEAATDPQLDAQEILERMTWINCRVSKPSQRRIRELDLIKSEGEGDWGTGIIDSQPRETTIDWPGDFRPPNPLIMSNEPDKVEETRAISSKDGP